MKKKIMVAVMGLLILSVGAIFASKYYIIVDPDCKTSECQYQRRCVINDHDRICGKCGGFMVEQSGAEYEDGYYKTSYKCRDCGLKCEVWIKFN